MTGGSLGPTARILRLLDLLQTRPVWSGHELADRLGVAMRQPSERLARSST